MGDAGSPVPGALVPTVCRWRRPAAWLTVRRDKSGKSPSVTEVTFANGLVAMGSDPVDIADLGFTGPGED